MEGMRKKIISSLALILVLIMCGTVAYANEDYSIWEKRGKDIASVVEDGENQSQLAGVISKEEFDVTIDFYKQQGCTDEEAKEKAREYLVEREAMYLKAIDEGFSVTDEEVQNYVDDLKSFLDDCENEDEVEAMIGAFESEEDYWNYEFFVYQKNLPIQNYVATLEKEYEELDASTNQISSEQVQGEMDEQEKWNEEFQKIKEEAAEEYKDIIVIEE